MKVSRWVVLSALMGITIGWQSTSGAPIDMPAGSKVWMKFEASPCPDADGDDCMGSNQAGSNPPNGLPLTTFGTAPNTGTGYAEILPGSIRLYSRGEFSNFLHASFENSYTVVGSAEGPFDIAVEFHATGEGRSIPAGPFHQLIAFGEAEIGVFQTFTDGAFSEGLRVVQPSPQFSAQSQASYALNESTTGIPFTRVIDVTAHHTVLNVSVGDTFTLAFGLNWRSSKGEGDFRSQGGVASFDLPAGVQLISSLAESLGLAGDYNDDGSVDAADYVVWRKNEGTTNTLPNDGGLPGPIDDDHYNLWRTNFGQSAGSGSLSNVAAPEPASLAMLLIGIAAISARRQLQ